MLRVRMLDRGCRLYFYRKSKMVETPRDALLGLYTILKPSKSLMNRTESSTIK